MDLVLWAFILSVRARIWHFGSPPHIIFFSASPERLHEVLCSVLDAAAFKQSVNASSRHHIEFSAPILPPGEIQRA
jgi:hypothetical protein